MRYLPFILITMFAQYSYAAKDPSEIRLGFLKQDVKSGLKHVFEPGYDVTAQYLWESINSENNSIILSPRPHIGCSISTRGRTNQYYGGLTWHIPIGIIFAEVSLGGEIHDGRLKDKTAEKKALGSRLLFRESISFGLDLGDNITFSVILDHASNARIAPPNPGLTGFGIQVGYKF